MPRWLVPALLATVTPWAFGAPAGPDLAPFVTVSAPRFALKHVTVIDGAGSAARADQTIVIADERIAAIGPAATIAVPDGAELRDYPGYSVLPGLVGLHDHFYYSASNALRGGSGRVFEPGVVVAEIAQSAPRLYLAAGITTLRTASSVEPYTDLKVRARIEAGRMPGPRLDLSAPYLEGAGTPFAQLHELAGPQDARRLVDFWAESVMTSFKAYMHITCAELAAAASEAHPRGFKITGHLCSVTWPEAVAAGVDDLEHGPVYTDSELVAGKQADVCPDRRDLESAWLAEPIDGPRVAALIGTLSAHRVAVTSTLAVFELYVASRPAPQRRTLEALSSTARESYLTERALLDPADASDAALLRKEMEFERAFVAAGGLLLVGSDPTGNGSVLPGFGNQRAVELPVEAGFNPLDAIHIATENGARFLGRDSEIGTLAPGKRADLVLVKGDPAARMRTSRTSSSCSRTAPALTRAG